MHKKYNIEPSAATGLNTSLSLLIITSVILASFYFSSIIMEVFLVSSNFSINGVLSRIVSGLASYRAFNSSSSSLANYT
jgi:hypothetical protein